MRWFLIILCAILVVLGYVLHQDPRVAELFSTSSSNKVRPAPSIPRSTGRELSRESIQEEGQAASPELDGPLRPEPRPDPTQASGPAEPKQVEQGSSANPLTAGQLARVLIGILRAKGLADGISLSISEDTLSVAGEVDSSERRMQIIEVLEAGRGQRRLDTSDLVVAGKPRS